MVGSLVARHRDRGVPRLPRPGPARLRHRVGHPHPELPADRRPVLHGLRPARDRHQPVLLLLRRHRPGRSTPSAFVCEAIRSGINAVRRGPGRGGAGDRPHLHPVARPGRSCPRPSAAPSPRSAASSSRCSRTPRSSAPSASAGPVVGLRRTSPAPRATTALPVITGVAIGYLCITIPAGIAPGRDRAKAGDRAMSQRPVRRARPPRPPPCPDRHRHRLRGPARAHRRGGQAPGRPGPVRRTELWSPLLDPGDEQLRRGVATDRAGAHRHGDRRGAGHRALAGHRHRARHGSDAARAVAADASGRA